jgi:hypothetical protein
MDDPRLAKDHNNRKGFVLRLLLGSLADAPPRVRERMLETIPTTPLSLAFYTVTLLVICVTTVYVTRATWACIITSNCYPIARIDV